MDKKTLADIEQELKLKVTNQRTNDGREEKRLARMANRLSGEGKPSRFGAGAFTRSAAVTSQRCAVKVHLQKNSGKGGGVASAKRHIDYIGREGAGKDGQAAELFGPKGEVLSKDQVEDFTKRMAQDRHSFRIIISPENGHQVSDLRRFAQKQIKAMEHDLGTKLDYVAAVHHDTGQPHIHLLVRGVNARGEDLVIKKDYISHGMRNRAQELLTRELGLRTEQEIKQALAADITKQRFTEIDRQLWKLQAEKGQIDLLFEPKGAYPQEVRKTQIARLKHLQKMGLAEKTNVGLWRMREDAQDVLRAMGMKDDVVRTLQQRMSGRGMKAPADISIFDATAAQEIVGRVIMANHVDETTGKRCLVVQDYEGRAHYVPIGARSERLGREAREGAIVRITTPAHINSSDKKLLELSTQLDPAAQKLRLEQQSQQWLSAFAAERDGAIDFKTLGREIKAAGKLPGVEKLPRGFDRKAFVDELEKQARALIKAGHAVQHKDGTCQFTPEGLERAAEAALGQYEKTRAQSVVVDFKKIEKHVEYDKRLPDGKALSGEHTAKNYLWPLERRAAILAKHGLIERVKDGVYRVPADALERLEAGVALARGEQGVGVQKAADLGKDTPRSVAVDVLAPAALDKQIVSPGATWLDRQIAAAGLEAPERPLTPFEKELQAAKEARFGQLEKRGIAFRDEQGRAQISRAGWEELDRQGREKLAAALAPKYGQCVEFEPDGRRSFVGKAVELVRTHEGPVLVVAREGEFVAVPAHGDMAKHVGRDTEIAIVFGRGRSGFGAARHVVVEGEKLEQLPEIERDTKKHYGGRVYYKPQEHGEIEGVVEARRPGPVKGVDVLSVAASDGLTYAVNVPAWADRGELAAQAGEVVVVRAEPRLGGADRNIIDLGGQLGGVYDPEKHERIIKASGKLHDGKALPQGFDLADYAARHRDRAESLAKLGVIERIEGGAYRVPTDAQQRIEQAQREGKDGGLAIKVEQRAPVALEAQIEAKELSWLDHQIAQKGLAPESAVLSRGERAIEEAKRRRAAQLCSQGLAKETKQGVALEPGALEALEKARDARLAEKYKERGVVKTLAEGQRQRGQVVAIEKTAGGLVAIVADGRSVTLAPIAKSEAREIAGKSVEVSRQGGQIAIAPVKGKELGLGR